MQNFPNSLTTEIYSKSDISKYLNIPIDTLNRYIFCLNLDVSQKHGYYSFCDLVTFHYILGFDITLSPQNQFPYFIKSYLRLRESEVACHPLLVRGNHIKLIDIMSLIPREKLSNLFYGLNTYLLFNPQGIVIAWLSADKSIRINPQVYFGSPLINNIPTCIIKDLYLAGYEIGDITSDFNLSINQVNAALLFENIDTNER
jgi:uncharacterized protein (DUF433 family)